MADVKISELPESTALTATDVIPFVINGVTKKMTAPNFVKEAIGYIGAADGIRWTVNITPTEEAVNIPLWMIINYSGNVYDDEGDYPFLQSYGPFFKTVMADNCTGTGHSISLQMIRGTGNDWASETACFFSQLISNSRSRLWGFDHHVHGPHDIQTHMMVGMCMLMGNYHPDTITGKSTGLAIQAMPGIGPLEQQKENKRTYPHDIGVLINGFAADPNGTSNRQPGFKVAFQAGGGGIGPWAPNVSWCNTAFLGRDYGQFGLYLGPAYSGTAPVAIAIEATAGSVGIGTTTPGQKLEVNGGIRMNTLTGRPAADAASRGTLWTVQGASGIADKTYICLKASGGTYSWVQIATG